MSTYIFYTKTPKIKIDFAPRPFDKVPKQKQMKHSNNNNRAASPKDAEPVQRAAPGIIDPAFVDEMRRLGLPLPRPDFWMRPEKELPSRVSRRGLPCPEVWDTYVPKDEKDMLGFITVRPRERRVRRVQRGFGVLYDE